MKKLTLAAIASALVSFGSFGAEIDMGKSVLNWKGTKVSGEHYGTLSFKSGNAAIEDGKWVGGEFVVDINSVTVTDLQGEWADKFLAHMKSGDFFEAEKYPEATLKITSAKGNSLSGDLTIKGKTHPVAFDYKKDGEAFVGSFKFDRTKYDMVYNSGNFFKDLGDNLIHDEVQVEFKVVPKRQ